MSSATHTPGVPRRAWLLSSRAAILGASLLVSLAVFGLSGNPTMALIYTAGAAAAIGLLLHPELALALFVVVGDIKGDDRVASLLPFDLTLAFAALVAAGIALKLIRGKRVAAMPPAYFLWIPLVAMMAISLSYTPEFDAGLEKLGRFLLITGIAIVAPFFALGTPREMKRFLIGFAAAAYAICLFSLSRLGGSERLVSPSDNTIGLGHVAAALIAVIWFAAVPRSSLTRRMLIYLLLAAPVAALIGAGARGAVVALAVVIFAGLLLFRWLLLDVLGLIAVGLAVLPWLNIPQSSLEYLATLVTDRSASALLDFRGALLNYGWELLQRHPLIGAGIGGFRYSSPNPGAFKWPHNVLLEIACELGIPAAFLICALFGSALRESYRQVKDGRSHYFAISTVVAALLVIGIINALNTGDINSDRSTWLFMSLVFVVRSYRIQGGTVRTVRYRRTQPVLA